MATPSEELPDVLAAGTTDVATSPASLVDVDCVAGVWWFTNEAARQLTYCFLDGDPITVADGLREAIARRDTLPVLAAPFYTVVPFEWDPYLP